MFIYLIVMAIIVQNLHRCSEIPNSAIASNERQRTSFLSYRFFNGVLGGVMMTYVTFKYILSPDAASVGQLNPAGYVRYGLIAAIVMVSAILISSLGTHRNIKYFRVPPQRRVSLPQILREMGTSPPIRPLSCLVGAALCGATRCQDRRCRVTADLSLVPISGPVRRPRSPSSR